MSLILEGRYRLVRAAGTGGTANVFLAEATQGGHNVAVKVLKKSLAEQQDMLGRFRREAATLEKVAHPHIVKLIELADSPQGLVLVMEWAEGERLDAVSLSPAQVQAVLRQLASALAAIHAAGVVHRDLKPENVIVEKSGEVVHARLLDFGIARFDATPDGGFVSMLGQVAGTPSYLSPEQIRGEAPTAKSDVYSFGVMGWRLATGAVPFSGASDFATLQMHLQEKLPTFKPTDASLAALEPVLRRCLEKKPDARFEDGTALYAGFSQSAPPPKKKWWQFGK